MLTLNILTNVSFSLVKRVGRSQSVCLLEKLSGMLSRISQREKPCFSLLMLLRVNEEQIVEAVPLMSVQGLDTFDLLKKQTSF